MPLEKVAREEHHGTLVAERLLRRYLTSQIQRIQPHSPKGEV